MLTRLRLNLGAKFTLLLALVFLTGMVVSWFALSEALQSKAEREVVSKAQILLKTMNSVRQYTSENVNVHLRPLLDQRSQFISETVPGYSARKVFEYFRNGKDYQDFLYKEATLNPTNLLDKADSFEASLVEHFRQDPKLPEQTGFREISGRNMFFTARPIRIRSPSCLECHSVPAAAPASMVKTYGDLNGFGWNMEEVIGSQIVYVPAQAVFAAGQQSAVLVTGIFVAIFAFAVIAITVFFRRAVIRPLGGLTAATQALSRGHPNSEPQARLEESSPVPEPGVHGDEIARLAERFDFMTREVYSREERLRQARADVARSEAHFRSLIEYASDAVMVLDAGQRVRYATRSLTRVLGFAPEDVVGKSPVQYVSESDAPAMQRALEAAAATPGVGPTLEFRCAGDGAPKYLEATLANMLDNPAVEGIVVNMRDVTERRHSEELALEKIRAEQSNKLKGQFLANMSHEIRTPMNGILGMTQLLLGTELGTKQRRFAQTIHHSGEALLGIINDILDFSKIEAGKLELENIGFDLHGLVQEVAELFAEPARYKGIELACQVHADVPRRISADPGRLRQILTNLVSNAIKFTQHGKVDLEVKLAPEEGASGHAQPGMLYFSVTDTGIGVNPEKAASLFQSFTQADSSTTRKYGGTGLGLAISKQLVEMMGGTIGLRSEPGRGSCFHFSIRAGAAAHAEASPLAAPLADASAQPRRIEARVLLAEDNMVNQELAVAMLEDFGCEVAVARDGREAVAAAERGQFDLILMDCQMPEMDGFEATRALREAEAADAAPGKSVRVPIIALTANAMEGDRERCLAAGMDDYLAKPFKQEQLWSLMTHWIKPAAPFEPPFATLKAPIDIKALDNIRTLQRPGASNLLERIVTLYLDNAPRLVQSMREASAAGDSDALQRASHALKSSSANLGALELAALCKEMEVQARTGRLVDPGQWISRIEREYARVCAALPRQGAEV